MGNDSLSLLIDLGTTSLAGRLVDCFGRRVAEASVGNPQGILGLDVIRRLEAALTGEGARLQALLVEGVDALVAKLLARADCRRDAIGAAAAAGNPAVCHLLRGLPVEPLLFPPHRPSDRRGAFLAPREIGLDLPVPLYLFPLVSGYVGGDLVAFLFSQPHEAGTLYLDVGTNGEMAFFDGGRWWATSVAAGPAFEGGEIACGMTAVAGAVTAVRLAGDALQLEVIGGGPPRGICGSGLASAVAAALDGGLLDPGGRIVSPGEVATNLARYLVETPEGPVLRLYRDASVDLLLTQQDVRNFQLAKGAVRAGVESLLCRAGVAAAAVRKVVLTGAFGFSLPPETLKRVALLPANMVDRVRFVPSGVLAGIARMLVLPDGADKVQDLADAIAPYPLSGTPAFEKAFLNALDF